MKDQIKSHIAAIESLPLGEIQDLADRITNALGNGGKVVLFGNGGSAADAQHIAAEFVGRYKKNRSALPAIALTTDTSILTAIGNDYGFGEIFARQVSALVTDKDVVIGISTSGTSNNVINGLYQAGMNGAYPVLLTKQGCTWSGYKIMVNSSDTARVQEAHILIGHLLCEAVENGAG